MRWLRILLRVLAGMSLLSLLMLLSTAVAYADNCGSFSDCFATTDAAAGVTIAVSIIIAVALFALPQLLEQPPQGEGAIPPAQPEPPVDPRNAANLGERRSEEGGAFGDTDDMPAGSFPLPPSPHGPFSDQAFSAQSAHPGIHPGHHPEIHVEHQQGSHQQHHT